jgi:hypothetical protein
MATSLLCSTRAPSPRTMFYPLIHQSISDTSATFLTSLELVMFTF